MEETSIIVESVEGGESASTAASGRTARSAGAAVYVLTATKNIVAKNVEVGAFVNTGDSGVSARSAEEVAYASMVGCEGSARSVVVGLFASTDDSVVFVKSVGGRESASMAVVAIIAKSVGGRVFASTGDSVVIARSVGAAVFASTVVSATSAKSVGGRVFASTGDSVVIARSVGAAVFASTVVSATSAKSVGGRVFASTGDSVVIARSVGAAVFASTVVSATSAKSVGGRVFASTDDSVVFVRTVGGVAFANTAVGAITARSVGAQVYVNTAAGAIIARSVGAAHSASTATSAVNVRREEKNARQRTKYQENTVYRLAQVVRRTVWRCLASIRDKAGPVKEKRSLEYIGCSSEQLKAHLERDFRPGMSWDNYGGNGWHVDHIVPIMYPGPDGKKPDVNTQIARLHFLNLQPMWSEENLRKDEILESLESPLQQLFSFLQESGLPSPSKIFREVPIVIAETGPSSEDAAEVLRCISDHISKATKDHQVGRVERPWLIARLRASECEASVLLNFILEKWRVAAGQGWVEGEGCGDDSSDESETEGGPERRGEERTRKAEALGLQLDRLGKWCEGLRSEFVFPYFSVFIEDANLLVGSSLPLLLQALSLLRILHGVDASAVLASSTGPEFLTATLPSEILGRVHVLPLRLIETSKVAGRVLCRLTDPSVFPLAVSEESVRHALCVCWNKFSDSEGSLSRLRSFLFFLLRQFFSPEFHTPLEGMPGPSSSKAPACPQVPAFTDLHALRLVASPDLFDLLLGKGGSIEKEGERGWAERVEMFCERVEERCRMKEGKGKEDVSLFLQEEAVVKFLGEGAEGNGVGETEKENKGGGEGRSSAAAGRGTSLKRGGAAGKGGEEEGVVGRSKQQQDARRRLWLQLVQCHARRELWHVAFWLRAELESLFGGIIRGASARAEENLLQSENLRAEVAADLRMGASRLKDRVVACCRENFREACRVTAQSLRDMTGAIEILRTAQEMAKEQLSVCSSADLLEAARVLEGLSTASAESDEVDSFESLKDQGKISEVLDRLCAVMDRGEGGNPSPSSYRSQKSAAAQTEVLRPSASANAHPLAAQLPPTQSVVRNPATAREKRRQQMDMAAQQAEREQDAEGGDRGGPSPSSSGPKREGAKKQSLSSRRSARLFLASLVRLVYSLGHSVSVPSSVSSVFSVSEEEVSQVISRLYPGDSREILASVAGCKGSASLSCDCCRFGTLLDQASTRESMEDVMIAYRGIEVAAEGGSVLDVKRWLRTFNEWADKETSQKGGEKGEEKVKREEEEEDEDEEEVMEKRLRFRLAADSLAWAGIIRPLIEQKGIPASWPLTAWSNSMPLRIRRLDPSRVWNTGEVHEMLRKRRASTRETVLRGERALRADERRKERGDSLSASAPLSFSLSGEKGKGSSSSNAVASAKKAEKGSLSSALPQKPKREKESPPPSERRHGGQKEKEKENDQSAREQKKEKPPPRRSGRLSENSKREPVVDSSDVEVEMISD
uniref:Uncharacterized protein n=1 Tax=Chromera velia CCMP2878 TaxID=1169474 RepID=A0A0G4I1U5_9ALVE|eukprot:Cvel_10217.t1-p1 / transcript=Cvel_10217.t1 / gene=Cvel_10217 / organism=Chromera_velia_CCMP2878 / gene_product=Zinc finger protein 283, putative / transcript_product=Zinc finger protein 283, putative / location=Cvel_scaffold611:65103-71833(-) / protein_length=1487 / sequence_SO=supercontig / SO=protein_coding / is_pseudo=false